MSTIKPGRETDAAIAEKLGWELRRIGRGVPPGCEGMKHPVAYPRYSTVESDAISALEATGRQYVIAKGESGYLCSIGLDGPLEEVVDFSSQSVEYLQPIVTGDAPTLCLAVCAAILQLARGGEG